MSVLYIRRFERRQKPDAIGIVGMNFSGVECQEVGRTDRSRGAGPGVSNGQSRFLVRQGHIETCRLGLRQPPREGFKTNWFDTEWGVLRVQLQGLDPKGHQSRRQ